MTAPFIVLEALDGVGKTTLARALAEHLDGVAMNTPGEGLRGVSQQLLQGLGVQQEARCLYYASTVLAQGVRARQLADSGVPIVMDRYWLSTVSYARARGVIAKLPDVASMVPPPDLTVLLELDEAERQRRLKNRGYTDADRETLSVDFRDCVVAEMTSLDQPAALRPSLRLDVTGLNEEEALKALVQGVERLLAG